MEEEKRETRKDICRRVRLRSGMMMDGTRTSAGASFGRGKGHTLRAWLPEENAITPQARLDPRRCPTPDRANAPSADQDALHEAHYSRRENLRACGCALAGHSRLAHPKTRRRPP